MAKFASLSEYEQSLASGYKLLPFNFTALNDDEYVLTNEVGEQLVLDRGCLFEFANHQIDNTSKIYRDLKSKHFLFDEDSDIALDLLPIKLRTRYKRLSDFTALHMFVVSLRCEHSCPYCQVSRQSDDKSSFDMNEEIAAKALNLVFRGPSPALKIEFQGGESLLNFPIIKFIVVTALELNQTHQRHLEFVIATNLAVLDDDMLAFCRQHDILISTSLDGPEDLHNQNRPRPGDNSHELTVRGIERCRAYLGKDRVSALMTTSPASLERMTDIVDEYVRLGFEGIFLRSLSPYGFALKTQWYQQYDSQRWLDFYFEGLDYIIDLNLRGTNFIEHFASIILTKMYSPFDTGFVDMMSPSGIGIGAIVYNYNGDVFASDESRMLYEMGDDTFKLGNVGANTFEDIFLSDRLLEPLEASFAGSVPMCVDCAFQPYCGSDPVFHHATQRDFVGLKPTSEFCTKNMSVFKGIIERMRADSRVEELFMNWASI